MTETSAEPIDGFTNTKPTLHLADWQGEGAPMLLVHGMAANTHWWDDCAPLLAGRNKAVALDMSGHGDSGRRESYTTEGWVDDIEQARHALGWPKMTLVAHSLGARIALEYAKRHPERLTSLVAIDFLPETHAERARTFLQTRKRPAPSYEDLESTLDHFRLQPRGTVLSKARLRELGRHCARKTPQGWMWKFDWASLRYDYHSIWPTLPQVRVPTLLVRGALSTVMNEEELARARRELPGAEKLTIAGAHHHVPLDRPRELAEAVLAFAGRHAGR